MGRPETAIIYDDGTGPAQAILNRVTAVVAGALDAGYRSIMTQVEDSADRDQLRRIISVASRTRGVHVLVHHRSRLHPEPAVRWLLGNQLGWRVTALTGPSAHGAVKEAEPTPEQQQRAWPLVAAIKGHVDAADRLDMAVAAAQATR